MTDQTFSDLDYNMVITFKNEMNRVDLIVKLQEKIGEWTGSGVGVICVTDIGHMIVDLVTRLGLLNGRGLFDYIQGRWIVAGSLDDGIGELSAELEQRGFDLDKKDRFYLRVIFEFRSLIRLMTPDRMPGFRDFFDKNKHNFLES